MGGEPIGPGPVVVHIGIAVPAIHENASTPRHQRGGGVSHETGHHGNSSVRVERNIVGAHVLGDIPHDTLTDIAGRTIHFPEAAPVVLVPLHADIGGVVQPAADLGVHFSAQRNVVEDILGIAGEQALPIQIPGGSIILHLIGTTPHGHVMLGFGTRAVEDEVVPVEVAQVHVRVGSGFIRNDPRPLRILRYVVAAVIQHLELLVGVRPGAIALERLVEIVGQGHIVVAVGDEIGRGGVHRQAEAAVVGNLRVALRAAFGGDQDHAGAGLGTIDGASRGILQDGDAFDIIGVDLGEGALDAIHEDERRSAVQGKLAADIDTVIGSVDRAAGRGQDQGRISTLDGHSGIGDGAGIQLLSVDDRDGARQVDPLLGTISDDHQFVQDGILVFHENGDGLTLLSGHGHLLVVEAQVGDRQDGRQGNPRHGKCAVFIGNGIGAGGLVHERCSDERLTGLVQDDAAQAGLPGGGGDGLVPSDGDRVSVNGKVQVLSLENLRKHLGQGRIFGGNRDSPLQVHIVSADDNGVVAL